MIRSRALSPVLCPDFSGLSVRGLLPSGLFRSILALPRILAPLFLLLAVSLPAQAANIFVTNTNDFVATGDGCSLREAVMNANTDSRSGSFECVAGNGDDVIILPPGRIQLPLVGADNGTADAHLGDLDVTGNLTVLGGGEQYSVIDGKSRTRIFDVQAGATLTLRRLTLTGGSNATQGGALRLGAGAVLLMEETIVMASSVTAADGHGGGLYLAAGSTADILRASLRGNSANAAGAQGGAIYCNGCTLRVHATSFTQNSATHSAGGLFLQGGSADLRFVSFNQNTAAASGALHSAGTLNLVGVISADNGTGVPGDDLACVSGSHTVQYSFAEYPSVACAADGLVAGLMSRADAPFFNSSDTRLLMNYSSDGRPSIIHPWASSSFRPVDGSGNPQSVPAGLCVEPAQSLFSGERLTDQWGRRLVDGSDCTNGSVHDRPLFSAYPTLISATVGDPAVALSFGIGGGNVDRDTDILLSGLDGAADDCLFAPQTLTIPTGTVPGQILVSPADLFGSMPALGRPERVCELVAEVSAGGDPRVLGATSGSIRIKVADDRSVQDISSPRNNETLNIGFVPVSTGGSASILYQAPAAGWTYTVAAGAITDDPDNRFQVTPVTNQPISASAPTPLVVACRAGGPLDNYSAVLAVSVSDGVATTWNYQYGLTCQVGHTVTLVPGTDETQLSEDASAAGQSTTVRVRLDSNSQVTTPFQVQVAQIVGTADASDFTLEPADGVVTFAPGDREQTLRVIAVNDDLIEGAEVLVLGMTLPPAAPVRAVTPSTLGLTLLSEDVLTRELTFTPITGLDGPVLAGERRVGIRTTLTNNSHPDSAPIAGLTVSTEVDQPVWLESFVIRSCPGGLDDQGQCPVDWIQANCTLEPSKRQASCRHPGFFSYGDEIEVLAIAWMADLDSAPSLNIDGVMVITASGRSDAESVTASVHKSYRLIGVQQSSGAAIGWPFLLVAVLLAWRGPRRRFVGLGG